MFEAGYPPSYGAHGRHRFLTSLETARKLAKGDVLEIAAGDGFLASCLADTARSVTVNDIRPLTASLGRWKQGHRIQTKVGDLFQLSGSFDLVIANEVIEHVAHGDRFLRKVWELVKPGGYALITTPNGRNFRSRLPTYSQLSQPDREAMEARQFQPDADGHLYLYTPRELRTLARKVGFETANTTTAISPWISGEMGFRFLPKGIALLPLYYFLDRIARWVPGHVFFDTGLILLAQRPKAAASHQAGLARKWQMVKAKHRK